MSESADIEGLRLEAIEGRSSTRRRTVETVEAACRISKAAPTESLATDSRAARRRRPDRCGKVVVQQSAVIAARGDEIGAEQSFVGGVVAQDVRLQASRIGLTIADTAQLDQSSTLILLAREVHGDVDTVLDTRGAAVAGILAGAVLGLMLIGGSLFLRRK
jgi:hypothetical protein